MIDSLVKTVTVPSVRLLGIHVRKYNDVLVLQFPLFDYHVVSLFQTEFRVPLPLFLNLWVVHNLHELGHPPLGLPRLRGGDRVFPLPGSGDLILLRRFYQRGRVLSVPWLKLTPLWLGPRPVKREVVIGHPQVIVPRGRPIITRISGKDTD